MKINLGAGHFRALGWVNLDLYSNLDIKSDICALPFRSNSADILLASHVLEHISRFSVFFCLKELFRVCKPGGLLVVRGPDANIDYDHPLYMDLVKKGYPEMPGYKHKWVCTKNEVLKLLLASGFDVFEDLEDDFPASDWPFPEMTIFGTKSGFFQSWLDGTSGVV